MRITIEKIKEVDEVTDQYNDPETGNDWESKYHIPESMREGIWERCVKVKRATGKKIQHATASYEQTLECDKEADQDIIESVIRAFNTLS